MNANTTNNIDSADPTGSLPPANAKGYCLEASVTTGVAFGASNTAYDITSLILTPGTWIVTGGVVIAGTTLASTSMLGWTSTTSGDSTTGMVLGDSANASSLVPTAAASTVLVLPPTRYSVSTNTTVYLKTKAIYSLLGDGVYTGKIRAQCIA